MIDLRNYGYIKSKPIPDGSIPGRVTEVQRGQCTVITEHGEVAAEIKGTFLHGAEARDDYKIQLLFNNGERRLFNAKPLLEMDIFKPLANRAFFQTVQVAYGSVYWNGDIDYCPDTLYAESVPV